MPDIIVKNRVGARDPKGVRGEKAFNNFSMKPMQPTDKGIKVGKAGRKLLRSDHRDESASAREKYRDNYDRIFGKKS